jgi:hypothetical protein
LEGVQSRDSLAELGLLGGECALVGNETLETSLLLGNEIGTLLLDLAHVQNNPLGVLNSLELLGDQGLRFLEEIGLLVAGNIFLSHFLQIKKSGVELSVDKVGQKLGVVSGNRLGCGLACRDPECLGKIRLLNTSKRLLEKPRVGKKRKPPRCQCARIKAIASDKIRNYTLIKASLSPLVSREAMRRSLRSAKDSATRL